MVSSLVPRLPPLARNYCVTFELVQKSWGERARARARARASPLPPAFLHKGHAIIARKGGSLGTRLHGQMLEVVANGNLILALP